MTEKGAHPQSHRFGVFQVDVRTGEVRKHGLKVKLQDQPFRVLAMLLEHPGEVVTREELRRRLWSDDTFVDFDHSLNIAINKLRETLGDSADNPRFVETLPRRGYRFLYPVETETSPQLTKSPVIAEAPPAVRAAAEATTVSTPAISKNFRAKLGIGLAFVLLLSVIVYLLLPRLGPKLGTSDGRMILAVLPFDNLTGKAEEEYFANGLTEEMISQLGHIRPSRLAVVAQTSSLRYARTPKTVDEIGRELHANYILTGSVRRAEDQLRIAVRLIQVLDQTQLWAESYERKLSDIFAIQNDVAMRVADALSMQVLPAEKQVMARAATSSMEAHEAYLLGRYYLTRRTQDAFGKACASFQQAMNLDPNFALAYAGLADCFGLLGAYNYLPAAEVFPKAKQAASRALELDNSLAEAYTSLGFCNLHYDWDWPAAEKNYRRAEELNPNYSIVHQWHAQLLHLTGRFDEALAEVQRGRESDPLSLVLRDVAGWIYLSMGQPDHAIEQFQAAHDIDPSWPKAYFAKAFACTRKGNYACAFSELHRAREITGDSLSNYEYLGYLQAVLGNKAEARKSLQWLKGYAQKNRVSGYSIALIHAGLGENQEALEWLQKALDERDNWLIWLKVNHEWDSLRSDPRFEEIVRKVGL